MVRLIDAEALKENAYMEEGVTGFTDMVVTVWDIDHAPYIDLIPCGKCRYWDDMPSSTAYPAYHNCKRPFVRLAMSATDFCSNAERREE